MKKRINRKTTPIATDRLAIGQNLKTRRRILGLTQAEVAEQMDITSTAYSKIERGECSLTIDRLKQLNNILGPVHNENLTFMGESNVVVQDMYQSLKLIFNEIESIKNFMAAETSPRYRVIEEETL